MTTEEKIKDFNKSCMPAMVKYKYVFMRENSFRFFRGTNHLFYEDIAQSKNIPPSPLVWACGDLHVENFGSYKADNRLVYFDLNDFDEALLAPAAWELCRMVSSIFISFDSLKLETKKAANMSRLFLKVYSEILAKGKSRYIERKTAKGIVCKFLKVVEKRNAKQMLKERTIKKNGVRILNADKKRHFKIDGSLKNQLLQHISEWIKYNNDGPYNFKPLDVMIRLAGTGSVGFKRFMFLLKSSNEKNEFLLLDMKQSTPSSIQPYINICQPEWKSEAERIITVQNYMQNISPALLSATRFNNEDYVIEEMQPTSDKINFGLIKKDYRNIYQVINDMALLTASAQLRSAGRQGSAIADELISFGNNTAWHEAIIQYGIMYRAKIEKDYKCFMKAMKKGFFKEK